MTPQLPGTCCISSTMSRRSQKVAVLGLLDHCQAVTMCNPSLRSVEHCGSFWPSSSSNRSVQKDGCNGNMRAWKNAKTKTAVSSTFFETSGKWMRYFRISCVRGISVERTPKGKADCQMLANVLSSATKGLSDRLSLGILAFVSLNFIGSDRGGCAVVLILPLSMLSSTPLSQCAGYPTLLRCRSRLQAP